MIFIILILKFMFEESKIPQDLTKIKYYSVVLKLLNDVPSQSKLFLFSAYNFKKLEIGSLERKEKPAVMMRSKFFFISGIKVSRYTTKQSLCQLLPRACFSSAK